MRVMISGSSGFLYPLDIAEPFRAGHILDSSQARALNRLLGEAVQRNKTRAVRRVESEEPDGLIRLEVWAKLAVELADYAAQYQFPFPGEEEYRQGSVEGEVIKLIKDEICDVDDPLIESIARRRLLAQRRVSERALEDL